MKKNWTVLIANSLQRYRTTFNTMVSALMRHGIVPYVLNTTNVWVRDWAPGGERRRAEPLCRRSPRRGARMNTLEILNEYFARKKYNRAERRRATRVSN